MRILSQLLEEVRELFNPKPEPPSIGEMIAAKSGGIRELASYLSEARHNLPHHFGLFCSFTPNGQELLDAFHQYRTTTARGASFTQFAVAFLNARGVAIHHSIHTT